jgi:hypothetical protein
MLTYNLRFSIPVCNIWLYPVEHIHGGFVDFEKHTIEDLPSKEMME